MLQGKKREKKTKHGMGFWSYIDCVTICCRMLSQKLLNPIEQIIGIKRKLSPQFAPPKLLEVYVLGVIVITEIRPHYLVLLL